MPHIIEKNPKILGGQPVIKGTRVPVARVMALIALNYSLKELKKEIPHLEDPSRYNPQLYSNLQI